MTLMTDTTILTIGSLVAASGLVVNILTIRKLSSPRPPNQELDKAITRIDAEIIEHERRITAIETARSLCSAKHLDHIDKLYNKVNATAEKLAETAGRLEAMFPKGARYG